MVTPKQLAELNYWRLHALDTWLPWYRGELAELHGRPCPEEKCTAYGVDWINAVVTFSNAFLDYYPPRLGLTAGTDYGRLLDVGCGPLGPARAFWPSEVWGVDPLLPHYRTIGYPLRDFGMSYVPCYVEDMWTVLDAFFDTVIAVNALDHVDDFPVAAREIMRVAKPGALVRLEIAYHPPSVTEPLELSDEKVERAFEGLGLVKLRDNVHSDTFRLTLWGTPDRKSTEEAAECPTA